jgi:short-subunit dehydrogenase
MHVVVTGASSGIGRDIAKAFDEDGNSISIVARRRPLLEELQREIRATTYAITADLCDADAAADSLVRAEERFGPIDVLVNNAGASFVEPVLKVDAGEIERLFQLNVHTPIRAIHRVLPTMVERGAGTIVNVASVAAFTAAPFMGHYHATKGALGNFSECLRLELANTGVHIVTVYPGPVKTAMADRNFDQFENSAQMRRLPTGDTRTLARLVRRAVARKRARVIYPSFYRIPWLFPWLSRFLTERTDVTVTGKKTPPLPGDLPPGET